MQRERHLRRFGRTTSLCNCLTGIAGAQCDRCQTGYYGSACDLCPEGGNETNSVPRITDTCGVAGSGRSRGTCDDGVAGSGNCTCFPHFAGESCTEGVCPAGTVENARKKGVFYEAFCEPCERGEYQVDDQCVKCPFPSTTTAVGATGATRAASAPIIRRSICRFGKDPVRCDDPAALEAQCREDAATCFDKCCLPCERGMDCGNPMNNTLRHVEIEDGWVAGIGILGPLVPLRELGELQGGALHGGAQRRHVPRLRGRLPLLVHGAPVFEVRIRA